MEMDEKDQQRTRDCPTDQPTDVQTDRRGHREFTFPINQIPKDVQQLHLLLEIYIYIYIYIYI